MAESKKRVFKGKKHFCPFGVRNIFAEGKGTASQAYKNISVREKPSGFFPKESRLSSLKNFGGTTPA